MAGHIEPTLLIKTRELEIELFKEEPELESRPKVRFIQEVRRIHLA